MSQKKALGFDKGYITIFKGYSENAQTFFENSHARYCTLWGWYVVSTEEPLDILPCGIEPVNLDWELVGNDDGALKSDKEVKSAIETLMYPKSSSVYVGAVGERLDLILTVTGNSKIEDGFKGKILHCFTDENGNEYQWCTAAKNWAIGTEHKVRGTIKEHQLIRNSETTILTNVRESK